MSNAHLVAPHASLLAHAHGLGLLPWHRAQGVQPSKSSSDHCQRETDQRQKWQYQGSFPCMRSQNVEVWYKKDQTSILVRSKVTQETSASLSLSLTNRPSLLSRLSSCLCNSLEAASCKSSGLSSSISACRLRETKHWSPTTTHDLHDLHDLPWPFLWSSRNPSLAMGLWPNQTCDIITGQHRNTVFTKPSTRICSCLNFTNPQSYCASKKLMWNLKGPESSSSILCCQNVGSLESLGFGLTGGWQVLKLVRLPVTHPFGPTKHFSLGHLWFKHFCHGPFDVNPFFWGPLVRPTSLLGEGLVQHGAALWEHRDHHAQLHLEPSDLRKFWWKSVDRKKWPLESTWINLNPLFFLGPLKHGWLLSSWFFLAVLVSVFLLGCLGGCSLGRSERSL